MEFVKRPCWGSSRRKVSCLGLDQKLGVSEVGKGDCLRGCIGTRGQFLVDSFKKNCTFVRPVNLQEQLEKKTEEGKPVVPAFTRRLKLTK